jgi:hypothetical protein
MARTGRTLALAALLGAGMLARPHARRKVASRRI